MTDIVTDNGKCIHWCPHWFFEKGISSAPACMFVDNEVSGAPVGEPCRHITHIIITPDDGTSDLIVIAPHQENDQCDPNNCPASDYWSEGDQDCHSWVRCLIDGDLDLPTICPVQHRFLRAAAEALRDRLFEIMRDEQYKGVWTLHHVHGGHYTGPTWEKPLLAVCAATQHVKKE
jgi:hypothetical protein